MALYWAKSKRDEKMRAILFSVETIKYKGTLYLIHLLFKVFNNLNIYLNI
jgi:hypothetical protein